MKLPSPIRTVILLLVSLFCEVIKGNCSPADTARPFALEIRTSYGFVIRHHLDMGVYTTRHFPCFEMNIAWPSSGKSPWQQYYGYPASGLSYWYSSLGNTKILGDVHAVFAWTRIPLFNCRKSEINIRLGCGIGYFRKIFDRYENYKNLAIGSHLNANLQLLLEYRYPINNRFDLTGSLGMAHFSNGTIVTPNYGINVPHASLALSWNEGNWHPLKHDLVPNPFKRHWNISLSVANGIKEILPVMGKKYLVYSFSAEGIYSRTVKGGIGAGLDVFWDGSERAILKRLKNETTNDAGLLKPGIKAIKQWNLGRTNLNFELGIYLYEKETSDGSVYDKLDLQYFITKRFFANVFLKTHYARADFIGWGCGLNL